MPIDVSLQDFKPVVIEGSMRAPVIVDFWAPWCAPCRALGPVLEKLEVEYQGKFTLAKINSEENQELAAQYGVRGIPNVKAFVGGRLVDEFSGALPERQVREFLDRVIPSPSEELRLQAREVYRESRAGAKALTLLEQALELDPQNERALIDSASIMTDLGRFDEAKSFIAKLSPLAQMDEAVAALRSRIDFAAAAAASPDAEALRQRIAANPHDLDARLQLANLCAAKEDYAAALDQLLEIVRRDRTFGDDIARKTMLQIFNLLRDGELVSEYRR
ncbi:MAG: thioredoxin, partial [Burkholderiales bacterium]|nr:thioredoxin [Burkholderiales bacterium]